MAKNSQDLELLTIQRVLRLINKLPDAEAQNRVVNYLSAKQWGTTGHPASVEAK